MWYEIASLAFGLIITGVSIFGDAMKKTLKISILIVSFICALTFGVLGIMEQHKNQEKSDVIISKIQTQYDTVKKQYDSVYTELAKCRAINNTTTINTTYNKNYNTYGNPDKGFDKDKNGLYFTHVIDTALQNHALNSSIDFDLTIAILYSEEVNMATYSIDLKYYLLDKYLNYKPKISITKLPDTRKDYSWGGKYVQVTYNTDGRKRLIICFLLSDLNKN